MEEEKAMLIDKQMKLKAKNAKLKKSEAMLKLEVVKYVNTQKSIKFCTCCILGFIWIVLIYFKLGIRI